MRIVDKEFHSDDIKRFLEWMVVMYGNDTKVLMDKLMAGETCILDENELLIKISGELKERCEKYEIELEAYKSDLKRSESMRAEMGKQIERLKTKIRNQVDIERMEERMLTAERQLERMSMSLQYKEIKR